VISKEIQEILNYLGYKVTVKVPAKPPHRGNNKFYWWRRYPIHQELHKNCSIEDKIKNGDFDYSPYWKQIQYEYYWLAEAMLKAKGEKEWCVEKEREIRTIYSKRINKLSKDAMKDEFERLETFKSDLKRFYGGSREEINEFVDKFEGSLEECVTFYKLSKKLK
jgi:hypothetical protein